MLVQLKYIEKLQTIKENGIILFGEILVENIPEIAIRKIATK